ncbi:hypothetical protein BT96DRAFT_1074829 [Gymnopus androsaceus JB14]|uniref:Uncharacterized protein n=1 Tax=Gymnopus androsaceus JB14 TaxID=1447944 RepID=A0A6A4GSE4_9AGAR|nr:hypothetical protein BT96DRAFT_1074829 [Gymnopus androsaceus JB14]
MLPRHGPSLRRKCCPTILVLRKWMEDLKKVVSEFAKLGISNSKELGTYHQKFSIVANSLQEHGILSEVQVASFYMQVSFPKKTKGQAYSLTKLRKAIDFLLSNASTTVIGGNFSISSITAMVVPKQDPTKSKLDQLTQMVSSLAQLMAQMASKGDSNLSRGNCPPKPSRSNKCFWDDCDSPQFDDCVDLRDWVDQG